MEAWIPVVVVLVGAPLTTIIANHFTRPKSEADVAQQYNEMAFALVKPQRERIDQLEAERVADQAQARLDREAARAAEHRCEERIDQVEAWAKLLYTHLIEVGETPVTFEQSVHQHRRYDDPKGE